MNSDRPEKVPWLFYSVTSLWLVLYSYFRGNHSDIQFIWWAGGELAKGVSPYYGVEPFRYAPPIGLLLSLLQGIPRSWVSGLMVVASLLMLLRGTYAVFKLYETNFGWVDPLQKRFALYLPWLLAIHGIGLQFEGGNFNIVTYYLCIEGTYQFCRRPGLGLILIALGTFIKPQYGSLLLFLGLAHARAQPRAFLKATFAAGLLLASPILRWGWSAGLHQYQNYFLVVSESGRANIFNEISAGDLSLYSFLAHVGGIPISCVNLLVLIPMLVLCTYWVLKYRNDAFSLALCFWFGFLFSPVSFVHAQMMMAVPGLWAILSLWDPRFRSFLWGRYLCVGLFLIACWGITFSVVGRRLYESIVVPYRLYAWLTLPLILALLPNRAQPVRGAAP